ncbi:hypothetical protein CYMTET_14080 [Cymbomonas tetramitiformis]|uniref:Uncharacterized protein n=1 Tax=Cymbomonas tetramitiformis TaxID=36881 RepID=A0AAE0LAK4_9CHLO|nr:hypothetical protein CYMTET_14080 [Cymbomonas tetramitiformis]
MHIATDFAGAIDIGPSKYHTRGRHPMVIRMAGIRMAYARPATKYGAGALKAGFPLTNPMGTTCCGGGGDSGDSGCGSPWTVDGTEYTFGTEGAATCPDESSVMDFSECAAVGAAYEALCPEVAGADFGREDWSGPRGCHVQGTSGGGNFQYNVNEEGGGADGHIPVCRVQDGGGGSAMCGTAAYNPQGAYYDGDGCNPCTCADMETNPMGTTCCGGGGDSGDSGTLVECGAHDGSKCTSVGGDCYASLEWGEPQTCAAGYMPYSDTEEDDAYQCLRWCDAGEDVAYVKNAGYGNACENDLAPITNQADCVQAALSLGQPFGGAYSLDYCARGCFEYAGSETDSRAVYFNTHAEGGEREDHHKICESLFNANITFKAVFPDLSLNDVDSQFMASYTVDGGGAASVPVNQIEMVAAQERDFGIVGAACAIASAG